MATLPASVHLGQGIEEIVSSIFENMLGLPTSPPNAETVGQAQSELRSSVEFTGGWRGVLSIECSRLQARHFAARFLSVAGSQIDDRMACDVLGELTNMIAGNLKPLLASGVRLSIGAVSPVGEEGVLDPHPEICRESHFGCAEGSFVIKLAAVKARDELAGAGP